MTHDYLSLFNPCHFLTFIRFPRNVIKNQLKFDCALFCYFFTFESNFELMIKPFKKENWKGKENKKNEKTPNLSFGCELPEKLTRRAVILDANSGCGGRPGPPRVDSGP